MRYLLTLLTVVRKEMTQITRDRRVMGGFIVAPVLQLVLFGYAINLDVDRVPTIVCDQDRTAASRDLVSALFADTTFVRDRVVDEPDEAQRVLETGEAAVVLVIPTGFATRSARHDDPQVQVIVDGADTTRAQVALNAASQLLMLHGIGLNAASASGRAPGAVLVPRILYNQRLKTIVNMLPGIAATLLLNLTAIQMAMGLAREREMGTIEQILVTPMPPSALIAGKCLPYVLFGMVDVVAVLALGSWLFDVPLAGGFGVIALGSALYLFSSLGVGLFLASISSSQQEALISAFGFIMPASLLSGFMSPIDGMPHWLKLFTLINPMRHFVEIMRGTMIKGAGFADLSRQLLALFVIGATVFTLSVRRFSRRLA
ncbi:MAG TPA: ABC transporter permease [Polyangia bacterium]|jgi:ABC-2 type transport system permease protein|nr:ABC transporter permease [Polyangia bacterium]